MEYLSLYLYTVILQHVALSWPSVTDLYFKKNNLISASYEVGVIIHNSIQNTISTDRFMSLTTAAPPPSKNHTSRKKFW